MQNIHDGRLRGFIEHCNKAKPEQGFEFFATAIDQMVEEQNQLHLHIMLAAALQHSFLPNINSATLRRALMFLEKHKKPKSKPSKQPDTRTDQEITKTLATFINIFEDSKKLTLP